MSVLAGEGLNDVSIRHASWWFRLVQGTLAR